MDPCSLQGFVWSVWNVGCGKKSIGWVRKAHTKMQVQIIWGERGDGELKYNPSLLRLSLKWNKKRIPKYTEAIFVSFRIILHATVRICLYWITFVTKRLTKMRSICVNWIMAADITYVEALCGDSRSLPEYNQQTHHQRTRGQTSNFT